VCVRRRAGGGVEEDSGEADRRERRRVLVRVEQKQYRGEDEASPGADDRPERTDGEADQHEQNSDCRGEGQRSNCE
jgi:hypothetical protein